ncbi:MAG: GNAT family N-acetyltransferase [Gemmatimonadaceae bacterium]
MHPSPAVRLCIAAFYVAVLLSHLRARVGGVAMSGHERTGIPALTFRPLAMDDLPLLREWLGRPHVARWWGAARSPAELEREFGPSIAGANCVRCFIVLGDGDPVGFIQDYTPADCHDDGWWLDEHDPGVRGMDQFLARADQLGRGIGTAMVRAFVARLFGDPTVTRVQIDPSPENHRAIRCYQKAGFHSVGEIDTPDGRALLMYHDRPPAAEAPFR